MPWIVPIEEALLCTVSSLKRTLSIEYAVDLCTLSAYTMIMFSPL
jgi:hypothetical protein